MWVSQLHLRNFRNYADKEFSFKNGVHAFIGKNAQGKSNLLEAISLALSGKSFRSFHPSDLITKQSETATAGSVRASIKKGLGLNQTNTQIFLNIVENKTKHLVNNKSVNKLKLSQSFGVVSFSPESLMAIKLGPQERRAIIDEILMSVDPSISTLFYDFQKTLRARNKLLKDIREGQIPKQEGLRILESIDFSYIRDASNLSFQRIQLIRKIRPLIQRVISSVFDSEIVEISVDYLISDNTAIDWDSNSVYDSISCRIKDLRLAEVAYGQSLVGPHKHDVKVLFNGRDSRYFCSQGQQRSLALALKIAQVEALKITFGEEPILLLDDVLSELDAQKQTNLVEFLNSLSGQIFISSTDVNHVSRIHRQDLVVYDVDNGNIKRQE